MVANIEQERAKMSYEVQVYREQLRLLEREIERINLTTVDLSNALRTIENIKNEEIMVPVGGGTFIKADVKHTKVLVSIGADYIHEIEREKAVSEIRKRIEATKKAFEKLSEQFNSISRRFQETNIRLNSYGRQPGIGAQMEDADREAYI